MGIDEVFMSMNEVAKRYGISRDGLAKLVRKGAFPAGIRLGKARRWALSTVQAWEAAQNPAAVQA